MKENKKFQLKSLDLPDMGILKRKNHSTVNAIIGNILKLNNLAFSNMNHTLNDVKKWHPKRSSQATNITVTIIKENKSSLVFFHT